MWSEEYQVAVLSEHFKAFDRLRRAGFFVGELLWNFADFKTAQSKLFNGHSIHFINTYLPFWFRFRKIKLDELKLILIWLEGPKLCES